MVWHAIPITRPDVRADDNKMRAINFPSDVAKYEVLNLRATWPHVPTPCCYMGPWGWGHLTNRVFKTLQCQKTDRKAFYFTSFVISVLLMFAIYSGFLQYRLGGCYMLLRIRWWFHKGYFIIPSNKGSSASVWNRYKYYPRHFNPGDTNINEQITFLLITGQNIKQECMEQY